MPSVNCSHRRHRVRLRCSRRGSRFLLSPARVRSGAARACDPFGRSSPRVECSKSAKPCAPCSTPRAFRIARPPRFRPPCSMKASICAPLEPCIGFWNKTAPRASAAISSPIPPYQKPELLATAPNQLWSWDITKLRGPAKWTYFYLYVILDVFSRYVVGWMVAPARRRRAGQQAHRGNLRKAEHPARPAHHSRRPRLFHALQARGVPAGRSQRHQDPQPALHLQRQSVFGKPVPHHEISPRVSRSLRLHSRQPRLLPDVLSLVQRRPSSFRNRHDDARHGPLRPGPRRSAKTVNSSSTLPTRLTPTASSAGRRPRSSFPRRSGSTNHKTQTKILTKLRVGVSQSR